MARLFILSFLFAAAFSLSACTVHRPASIVREDPLINNIFDARTKQAINFDILIQKIAACDVIYLSEKHNNAAQHAFQAKVIQALLDKNLSPTLAFEFFAMDDTPDLLNFIDSGKAAHSQKMKTAVESDLRKKLGWDTQTDTMWKYYFDLLKIAEKNSLTAAGIDLASSLKRRITRKGYDGLTALEKEQLFSSNLDDSQYKKYMFDIFKEVHCGMEHGNMQQRLYDTWLARNDKMALSISQLNRHKKQGPVVVIIGGGHTEYHLGVMDRVSAIAPAVRQVNVALTEISINPSSLTDYLAPLDLEEYPPFLPADFMVFFQRVSYENPCEKFKKQLERMKKNKESGM